MGESRDAARRAGFSAIAETCSMIGHYFAAGGLREVLCLSLCSICLPARISQKPLGQTSPIL